MQTFIMASFKITPNWKQWKCLSMGERLNKLVYPRNRTSFDDEKKQTVDALNNMHEYQKIMLNERS